MLCGQRLAGSEHVLVHLLDPGDESVEVARPAGLAYAMHGHAAAVLGRSCAPCSCSEPTAAGQHVHGHPLADQRLGELAHVPGQAALDHGRVLPGEEEHAVAHRLDPIYAVRAEAHTSVPSRTTPASVDCPAEPQRLLSEPREWRADLAPLRRRMIARRRPAGAGGALMMQVGPAQGGRAAGAGAGECAAPSWIEVPIRRFYSRPCRPTRGPPSGSRRVMPEARWRGCRAALVFKANGRISWGLTDEREPRASPTARRARRAHGLGPIRWPRAVADERRAGGARDDLRATARPARVIRAGGDAARLPRGRATWRSSRRPRGGPPSGIDAGELERALADEEIKHALRQATDDGRSRPASSACPRSSSAMSSSGAMTASRPPRRALGGCAALTAARHAGAAARRRRQIDLQLARGGAQRLGRLARPCRAWPSGRPPRGCGSCSS